jgi:hypothetical protein
MAYTKIDWKDKAVEYPRRYNLIEEADGKVTLIPAPGEVTQEATPLNAENLNHMEQGIADAHEGLEGKADTTHGHKAATTTAAGFLSPTDKSKLDTLDGRVNQGVKSTDSPEFAGLTVNGVITGATFN